MIGYLDEFLKPLALILRKMSGYVKTHKDKNNRLMSFYINNDKLLEKYINTWTKIKEFKKTELNALLVFDDIYI